MMEKSAFYINEGKLEKSEPDGKYTFFFDSSETDSFTERKDINEFLRDGAVINALYDQTLDLLYENSVTADYDKLALRVLNSAYKICWMITYGEMTYGDITGKMYFRRGDYLVRDLSYYVAWSILKVYKEFYQFDETILDIIRSRTTHKDLFASYRELVRMQDDPCLPICFSTPGVRILPSRPCLESTPKGSFDSEVFLRMLRNHMAHTESVELEDVEEEQEEVEITPVDDMLESSFSSIRNTYNTVMSENERLTHVMIEMEGNHKMAIEGKDSTISRLRAEISTLKQQLVEKETKVEVKEVVKKVIVKEPEPMTKILNWDSITDYALGLGNFKEVQVVYTMLNRISSRGRYFDDGLEQNLQKLEAYIRDLQKPIINQTNSGCQQFYGNINDSQFSTPNE